MIEVPFIGTCVFAIIIICGILYSIVADPTRKQKLLARQQAEEARLQRAAKRKAILEKLEREEAERRDASF